MDYLLKVLSEINIAVSERKKMSEITTIYRPYDSVEESSELAIE